MLKNTLKGRKAETILGVNIDSTSKDILLKRVLSSLKQKQKFFVVTPNPEIVLLSQHDQNLKQALNAADISLPDGSGIIFAARVLGKPLKSRIIGRLFMTDLFLLSDQNKLKIYLLGGDTAVIEASLDKLKREYPHLTAQGSVGPKLGHDGKPINSHELQNEKDLISKINTFSPDILFIGFGAPKQEKWFYLNKDLLKVGGAMVIGGSLDVYSENKKLPPVFFSSLGLEWLWRLIHEPMRLRRILNATVVFPLYVFREKLRDPFI